MEKVLVALSGGIDSAAAALILYERGYRVTAVTFDLTGNPKSLESTRRLAERLKIPLIVEEVREVFRQEVQEYFIRGYLQGETPAPCSVCNPRIKWAVLRRVANRENIPLLATGHYVRIVETNGFHYVATGVDPIKDQSYYLWDLEQEILRQAVTPLGDFTKTQVRELMRMWGFGDLTEKRESMGVCFLDRTGYAGFLRDRVPGLDALTGGVVVNPQGDPIGRHAGYPFYTVGQKRGFSLDDPQQERYVTVIDPANNTLTVDTREHLYKKTLYLRDFRIVDPAEFFTAENLRIKIRGVGVNPEGFCTVYPQGDRLVVEIPGGAYAPAPGQPVVFYIDRRVVGGGYIV
jgi:tRNA-specific 2-thiouridylase